MKNPYCYDFTTNTLTMTKAFAEKASIVNTEEYKLVKQAKADSPNLKIALLTHRTPTRYHNKDGSITRHNQFKGLTVERMENFIKALPNSEEHLKEFCFLKEQSSYTILATWFKAQYPHYFTNPICYINNHVDIAELEDVSNF